MSDKGGKGELMKKTALLVMADGIGSRFGGGIKQLVQHCLNNNRVSQEMG